jgi:hypothetical protein
MSICTGLYPTLDLWNMNKLHYITLMFCQTIMHNIECGDTTLTALLPLSVLCFTSQQRSFAASISVSLLKRPFGAPASETTSAGHAYQLRHLTNGEANQRADIGIKEASFPSSSISPSDQLSSSHHHYSSWSIRAVNSQDLSRRKKLHPAAWPWCLVDRALHHPAAHTNCQYPTTAHHIQDFKQLTKHCIWL